MSLSRLWRKKGKKEQTRHLLVEVYGWFAVEVQTEPGFSEAPGLPEGSPVKRRTGATVKAPDGVVVGLYTLG